MKRNVSLMELNGRRLSNDSHSSSVFNSRDLRPEAVGNPGGDAAEVKLPCLPTQR